MLSSKRIAKQKLINISILYDDCKIFCDFSFHFNHVINFVSANNFTKGQMGIVMRLLATNFIIIINLSLCDSAGRGRTQSKYRFCLFSFETQKKYNLRSYSKVLIQFCYIDALTHFHLTCFCFKII